MVGNLHSKITIHCFRIQKNVNMFYVVFSSKVYFFYITVAQSMK